MGHNTAGSRVLCLLSKDRPRLGASPLGVEVTRWEGGARSWGKEVGSAQLGARWAEAAGGDTGAPSSGPSLPPPSSLFLLLSGPPPPPWSGSSSWQAATQSADAALQSRLPATLPQSGCWAPAAAHFQALGRQGSDVRLLTSGLTASPCQLSLPHSLS